MHRPNPIPNEKQVAEKGLKWILTFRFLCLLYRFLTLAFRIDFGFAILTFALRKKDVDLSILTFTFRRNTLALRGNTFAFRRKKKRITRSIFNALIIGLSKSFSRSTVRFNFGFYRPTQKAKTKIKRYLGRALPNTSLFENALNIE
jgi:hypothetical protein